MLSRISLATVGALVVGSVVFPGCLDGKAPQVTIPYPRLGDRVSFVNLASGATITYDMAELVDLWLPIGKQIPTLRIHTQGFSRAGSTTELDLYVNILDNTLYKFVDLCKVANENGCTSFREESFKVKGSPWGFGSSLVHGQVLQARSEFERKIIVNGDPATVTLQVEAARQVNGTARAFLKSSASPEGSWMPPVGTAAFVGEFEVEDGNPYVVQARFEYPVWVPEASQAQPILLEIRQTGFEPGAGPAIPWENRPPPSEFPCFSVEGGLERGLPPDMELVLERFLSSFQEFVDYLESAYPPFAAARGTDGFYVTFLQMNNGTAFRVGELAEERTVKLRLRYHDADESTNWIVVSKEFRQPNPLNSPPRYSFTVEGSHPTIYPRDAVPITPVPFNKVYGYHVRGGAPWNVTTIEVAPGSLQLEGKPASVHFEYNFWSGSGTAQLSPTTYDARTGCVLSRSYLDSAT